MRGHFLRAAAGLMLLDAYSGAAAAYSLRQLRAGATNVVRIRRSSDNVESDFTASQVSNGTLTTWLGGSSAYVRTWYDQSGNGRNLEQATTAAQPLLVSTSYLDFDGSNDFLRFTGSVPTSTNLSTFAVMKKVAHINNTGFFSLIPAGASPNDRDWASSDGRSVAMSLNANLVEIVNHYQYLGSNGSSDAIVLQSSISIASTFLMTFIEKVESASMRINAGTLLTDTHNASPTNPAGIVVGARYDRQINQFGRIEMRELIIYGTDQTASESAIRANINTYHAIY